MVKVKERPDIGVYVKDLSAYVVNNADDMDKTMTLGNKNRKLAHNHNWTNQVSIFKNMVPKKLAFFFPCMIDHTASCMVKNIYNVDSTYTNIFYRVNPQLGK